MELSYVPDLVRHPGATVLTDASSLSKLIIMVLGFVWFFVKRRRQNKDTPHISTYRGTKRVDLHGDTEPHDPEPSSAVEQYEPVPFVLPPASAGRMSEARTSEGGLYPPG